MNPDPVSRLLEQTPLVKFSVYTQIQSETISGLGQEILHTLDSAIRNQPGTAAGIECNGSSIKHVYGQFWLWVLGAYEIVRTMERAGKCFSPALRDRLQGLKKELALIRMPFAKQELPGKKVAVEGEPSICDVTETPPDLKFAIREKAISVRQLIEKFEQVFSGIGPPDVLADHRTAYGN